VKVTPKTGDLKGEYFVSFIPQVVGNHQISVSHKGSTITGSFSINVVEDVILRRNYEEITSPFLQFGEKGTQKEQLLNPTTVVSNSKSELVVADSGNSRVLTFDSAGKLLAGIQLAKKMPMQSFYVAVDPRNDQVVMALPQGSCIHVLNNKGELVRSFGSAGSEDGQFKNPSGVVVDQEGNYYVTDTGNHRIQVFNSEGQFARTFGSEGPDAGNFNEPRGISLSRKGFLAIADSKNNRVEVYNKNGGRSRTVGAVPEPQCVFIDGDDNVLVYDREKKGVAVFNPSGILVKTLGEGKLQASGICMNQENKIVVLQETSRLNVY